MGQAGQVDAADGPIVGVVIALAGVVVSMVVVWAVVVDEYSSKMRPGYKNLNGKKDKDLQIRC